MFEFMVLKRLACAALLVLLASSNAQAADCAGVQMPDRTAIDGKELVLNGMGVREATILNVDVYVAGLYVERRSRDGEKIAHAEQAKQMRLTFVRDVDREDMVENLEAGFRNAAGADYAKLAARFERLKKAVPRLKVGDTFSVTYRPGSGLEVKHGQKLMANVPGADFASTIFLIWLGKKPPNEGLKTGLLGGRCG